MKLSGAAFKNKDEMFKGYFLVLKGCYLFSGFLLGSMLMSEFSFFVVGAVLAGGMMLAGQFYLAVVAQRLIEKKNYLGFLLAMVLTVMLLVSFFFPVAVFGLYSLLNRTFRDRYVSEDVPTWLADGFRMMEESVGKLKLQLARK